MQTSVFIGFVFIAIGFVWFAINMRYVVQTLRETVSSAGEFHKNQEAVTSLRRLWHNVAIFGVFHFVVLEISTASKPSFYDIGNKVLVVFDTMAKGAMLDLLESFEISFAKHEPDPQFAFACALTMFIARTFYSIAFATFALVYFTRLMRWWKNRR